MREIKFRAWSQNDAQMMIPNDEEHYSSWDWRSTAFGAPEVLTGENWNADKSAILMQCTGLKDKSGKDIYEGDVVLLDNNLDSLSFNAGEKMEVCFNDGCFVIRHKEFENKFYTIGDSLSEIEVIGNIYENKELLND